MFFRLLSKLFNKREEGAGPKQDGDVVKPFLDHLEDLRWTIVKMVVTLVIGLANHFTAPATFANPETVKGLSDQFFAMMAHQQSVFWGTVAVVLQGMVIALLVYVRGK